VRSQLQDEALSSVYISLHQVVILGGAMKELRIIDANRRINYWEHITECWQRRDLILTLVMRDIRVRYVQTYLGILWAILHPVISVLLLVFVFSIIAGVDTQTIPPVLFVTSGLCVWNYFSRVVAEAGDSVIGAQSLVKKIYFPRLVIPVSKAVGGFVEFGVVLLMLFCLLIIYQYPVSLKYLWLIPGIFVLFLISLGLGIWVAALSIRYRDFHYIVPILLRIGMFVSPIAYGSQHVPEGYKWIIRLNPLTGIMDTFRWIMFDLPLDMGVLVPSFGFSMLLLISGILYFIRMEKYIADII
jgi:lipopolysaccharide transport system permease protein